MRLLYACFLCIFTIFQAEAQHAYEVTRIPKELLPRASAVIRSMEMRVEIKTLDQVSYTMKQVITVLNKNGDSDAAIYIWYNKSRQIKSIRGTMYDEFGKPFAKLSAKEFSDVSAASNSSLFEDSRVKIFRPNSNTYPYTLEYEYEIRSKQSLNLPDWYPNSSTGVAVEYASFTVQAEPDFNIRYKEVNYPGTVKIQIDDKFKTYHWEVKGLKAIRDEPYSPLPETFLTSVKIAPETFSYQGIKGEFTDWNEYGKWMYEALLKDRNKIPEQTAAYIRSLTKDIAEPTEKAKKIYEYVQQKTRYVSIQVGIGGYQPFLASEVDRTGYGDCKALVNYTQGLLNVAGIESHYVVVASGDKKRSAISDFASMNQFDHVILCIPFESDTVWLDCTSKENPYGYLGTFTDDRLAIACTADGGKLVRTPAFESSTSQQVRIASFKLDSIGSIEGSMETTFKGWQYDNRDFLIGESLTEQLKKIPEIYRVDNIAVESFQLNQNKNNHPLTAEQLKFKARNYGSLNADLMFVPLNRINQSPHPQEIRNRENKLYINRGYVDVDSIVFELPTDFKIEGLPRPVSVEYPFGTFEMKAEISGEKLHYFRRIFIKEGTFSAKQYDDLVRFYRIVADADADRFVLRRISAK